MDSHGLKKHENSMAVRRSNILIAVAFGFLSLVVLTPVLAVDIPPLVDYPNHLAEMYLAVHLKDDPLLQEYYQVGLSIIPNLAQNFIVPALSTVMDVEDAMRLFLGWSLVQIAVGAMAVHFAVTRRLGWWPLGAFALLYNWVLSYGFLNYLFTVGLALNLFALWIWMAERGAWVRAILLALIAPVVFLLHLFGLGFLGLCIGGFQLWRTVCELRAYKESGWRNFRAYRELLVGMPALLIVILLWSAAPIGEGGGKTSYGRIGDKLLALLSPAVMDGSIWDQMLILFLVVAIPLFLISNKVRILPQLRYPLALVVAAAVLMPTWILGVYGMDFRLPFVAGCLFFAAMDLRNARWPAWAVPVGITAAALIVVRTGDLTISWRETDARISELRMALQTVPKGSKVLPVATALMGKDPQAGDYIPAYWHMTAFAVIDRSSFDPMIFSDPSEQSISVHPRHQAYDALHGVPVTLEKLLMPEENYPAFREALDKSDNHAYWYHWWRNFDYVLWINFGVGDNPAPERLETIEKGSFFQIFAVTGVEQIPSEK